MKRAEPSRWAVIGEPIQDVGFWCLFANRLFRPAAQFYLLRPVGMGGNKRNNLVEWNPFLAVVNPHPEQNFFRQFFLNVFDPSVGERPLALAGISEGTLVGGFVGFCKKVRMDRRRQQGQRYNAVKESRNCL